MYAGYDCNRERVERNVSDGGDCTQWGDDVSLPLGQVFLATPLTTTMTMTMNASTSCVPAAGAWSWNQPTENGPTEQDTLPIL